MVGKPVALTAQLFQFLGAERLEQQFVDFSRGVERGAQMRIQ